jgi:hypothetical protein
MSAYKSLAHTNPHSLTSLPLWLYISMPHPLHPLLKPLPQPLQHCVTLRLHCQHLETRLCQALGWLGSTPN